MQDVSKFAKTQITGLSLREERNLGEVEPPADVVLRRVLHLEHFPGGLAISAPTETHPKLFSS